MVRISNSGSDRHHAFAVGVANLSESSVRAELAATAPRAFVRISERWNLSDQETRLLLGGVSSRQLLAWSASEHPALGQDILTRISLLLEIYGSLGARFGDPWARRWIAHGDRGPLFSSRAPLAVMIDRGISGTVEVRRTLEFFRVNPVGGSRHLRTEMARPPHVRPCLPVAL